MPVSAPPAGPPAGKWWVLLAIGIGTFMTALDGSVVNTILPLVGKTHNSSIAGVEWVVTIYLLVLSGLLLSFGRLGDLRGHRQVYLGGFGIFIASSALCGLAGSLGWLIALRAVQALGAAMLAANSPAILTGAFPARQRGRALGLQATMTYLGLTAGPSLGGWLAENFGWPWVFYINVPIGLLAFWLSWRFIAADHGQRSQESFDLRGAATFIAALSLLLLGLNQGHNLGWTSWPVVGALLTAAILAVGFIRIEQSTPYPMLDLSLFQNRTFSAATGAAILNYICVYSITFLMPFHLLEARGFSPARAGLILTAMPVVMALVAPVSGALSDRIGTRLPSLLGMIFLSAGLALLATLRLDAPVSWIAAALGLAGLGIGIFVSPNTSALMGAAPRHRQGIASGILASCRNIGMVLGVGLAGAVFTTVLTRQAVQDPAAVLTAIEASFWVAAAIAAAGAVLAAIRPAAPGKAEHQTE